MHSSVGLRTTGLHNPLAGFPSAGCVRFLLLTTGPSDKFQVFVVFPSIGSDMHLASSVGKLHRGRDCTTKWPSAVEI